MKGHPRLRFGSTQCRGFWDAQQQGLGSVQTALRNGKAECVRVLSFVHFPEVCCVFISGARSGKQNGFHTASNYRTSVFAFDGMAELTEGIDRRAVQRLSAYTSDIFRGLRKWQAFSTTVPLSCLPFQTCISKDFHFCLDEPLKYVSKVFTGPHSLWQHLLWYSEPCVCSPFYQSLTTQRMAENKFTFNKQSLS